MLTGLPAEALGLRERGGLAPGQYADVVIFDPDRIRCHEQSRSMICRAGASG
jgi:N-acyl-D-aspartate/D-glutamate deacylase